MTQCTQCAAQNPPHAKFCNQCGAGLVSVSIPRERSAYTPAHLVERVLKHRSAMEGERKQVTVFFADMAGSTQLAGQVDPEQWHRILDDFFSILAEEIHRFEGTINQFTGDGVMALFGAPLALEDHAARAAHAALSLKKRLRSFADSLRLQQGINLSTRMGMNSGEVVVGRIGDDMRMDYTAKGLTVNLAARMEQIAEPGRVYLTADTAALIDQYFELESLGPMQVKGSSTPIEVFELLAQSRISLRLEAAKARGLTGFTGRQAELEMLRQLQQRSAGGERQIAVVMGDAGLGKSRLCHEAVERWRHSGVTVLSCSGVPHAQAVPLQPVRELVLQRFGVQAADAPALARQKIAGALLLLNDQLRGQLPLMFEFLNLAEPDSAAPQLPPEVRDQRIRELFRQICLAGTTEPQVILIEDLHWLDEGSQQFFATLLDCSGSTATLVLCNMRPGALPPWLASHGPQELRLQPLDAQAMAGITQSLLGVGVGLEQLARQIAQRAAGNPFFIEETVRALASAGRLQGETGHYVLQGDPASVQIPASVQAVIAGRVDRLEAEDKALLQLAAVLGQRFARGLLAASRGGDKDTFSAQLVRLELGNYLAADDVDNPEEISFCHPLLQEVVYASLLSDRRRSLHRQVGELLETRFAENGCQRTLVLLAHHWDEAAEPLKAARWSVAAGLELARHNVMEEIRYMRRAIEILTPLPAAAEALPIAIAARAGIVRAAAFFPLPEAEVEDCYQMARTLAERKGDQAALAELLISNGVRLLNHADADRAVENTGEAMSLVQAIGAHSLETRFRLPILFSYFAAGRLEEGLAVLDRRDGGAWHHGDVREDTMLSRGFRALMLVARGGLREGLSEARAALACAARHELKMSWLNANLVDIQLLQGDLGDGLVLAEIAEQEAEEFGSPMFIEVAKRAKAQALLAAAEVEPARKLLVDTLELVAPGAVAAQFEAPHRMILAQALLAAAQAEPALHQIKLAIAAAERTRQRIWELRAQIQHAHILAFLSRDLSEVISQVRVLIKLTGANLFLGDCLELEGLQSLHLGHQSAARDCIARAAEHWQHCGANARAAQLLERMPR